MEYALHIPVLLGSKILPQLIVNGVETVESFLLQNTRLGLIASGPAECPFSQFTSAHVSFEGLDIRLRAFWDIPLSKGEANPVDDQVCEELYQKNHYLTLEGRYVAPTSWRSDYIKLGSSYHKAVWQFLGQEKR